MWVILMGGQPERRDPVRAALRRERDPARGRCAGRERRVQPHAGIGVQHTQAVGADKPHAAVAAEAQQLLLAGAAVRPGLAETGRQHDKRSHVLRRAITRHVEHGRGGDSDHSELDRPRHIGERRVRGQPGDLPGMAAHVQLTRLGGHLGHVRARGSRGPLTRGRTCRVRASSTSAREDRPSNPLSKPALTAGGPLYVSPGRTRSFAA